MKNSIKHILCAGALFATLTLTSCGSNNNEVKNVEVKANNSVSPSLNKLVKPDNKYSDIRFGIKLCAANIGFNGSVLTLPYFTTFMLRRFLKERVMG